MGARASELARRAPSVFHAAIQKNTLFTNPRSAALCSGWAARQWRVLPARMAPEPRGRTAPAAAHDGARDRLTTSQHHGEQDGFQVTPISQDKCAPGYQRPGNLRNPTVRALLKKVMEMEGAEAAIGGPCGMSIISQTYMALLKPGDRVVAHRCNYDWVMTLFRDYLPS